MDIRTLNYMKDSKGVKYFLLLALGLELSGCAKTNSGEYYVEPEFEPYVNMYVSEGLKRGVVVQKNGFADDWTFIIKFGNLSSRALGECKRAAWSDSVNFQKTSHEYREITIDRSNWDHIYEYTKVDVLFHELTHCAQGRGHDNSVTTFTIDKISYIAPKSIMNTYSVSEIDIGHFVRFENYYFDEIFSSKNSTSISADIQSGRSKMSINNEGGQSESCYFENKERSDGEIIGYSVCALKESSNKIKVANLKKGERLKK